MKFLIDTNVFIPLEPGSPADIEATTEIAARFHLRALELGSTVFLHPASLKDFERDKKTARASLRLTLSQKYPPLPDPPPTSGALEKKLGSPSPPSNDWVDLQMIAALEAEAVDFLVTEDQGIRRKAKRVGLGARVLGVSDAVVVLEDLLDRSPNPLPAVQPVKAHAIDSADPILDSFRQDYPGFDSWLQRCKRQHRQAWVVRGAGSYLAALCIVKPETPFESPTSGKTLKICSFKVSDSYSGFRYGELLMKAVFDYAFTNRYEWLYVTAFEKHDRLMDLLRELGFEALGQTTPLGEIIMAKPLTRGLEPPHEEALAYHIRRGPLHFRGDVSWFLVPIQPRYASVLFPEASHQHTIFPGLHAFGNSIRKAYLCHASTRSLEPGSVLVFYRSQDLKSAIAIGIVEATLRSSSPEEIAKAVVRRTVYSLSEIRSLCHSEVLVILFRQALIIDPPISLCDLMGYAVFSQPPQSIMRIRGKGLAWLRERLLK